MSRGGGRGGSHAGRRGGGRRTTQVVGRGGMSRGGKRRSPRNSKKKKTNAPAPSNNATVDNEGDRPSSQEPSLRIPVSHYGDRGRIEEDVDEQDSVRAASQTVKYKDKPSTPAEDQVEKNESENKGYQSLKSR